jgi:hypothetical protein
MFRRRSTEYDGLDKENSGLGHMTVAGETYAGTSTLYSVSEHRQTRFADDVPFADGGQSLAGLSEWAISTKAVTEDNCSVGSEAESDHMTATSEVNGAQSLVESRPTSLESGGIESPTGLRGLFDNQRSSRRSYMGLFSGSGTTGTGREVDAGEDSEDEDVPMRVVDLIKMFTPPRR